MSDINLNSPKLPIPKNLEPKILTDTQKLSILNEWEKRINDPPSIDELVQIIFPNSSLDGRSNEGRLIKKFLIENDLKVKTTEYKKKIPIELTEEQKEYIKNNTNEKSFEIAKILFNNKFLAPASQEVKTVAKYKEELIKSGEIKVEVEEENFDEYSPPKRIERVCARINTNIEGCNFDYKNLTPTQKKQALSLMNYLHNLRFSHHMNLINNKDDRKLFENTFIKYIYDKTDLSQEDLDQYLTLANEAIMESSIKRTISMLEEEQKKTLDETSKISMTIVEALKTSRDEYNACINRQQKLYKSLEVERSKRLNERIGPQFTLLNIIEEMKNEERRKELVKEAEKRNEKLKGEIERFSKMDDIIARLYGCDEDLIING